MSNSENSDGKLSVEDINNSLRKFIQSGSGDIDMQLLKDMDGAVRQESLSSAPEQLKTTRELIETILELHYQEDSKIYLYEVTRAVLERCAENIREKLGETLEQKQSNAIKYDYWGPVQ